MAAPAVHEAHGATTSGDLLAAALNTLGLDRRAQADLAELAYWYQVERCRCEARSESDRAQYLTRLNEARLRLSAAAVLHETHHSPDVSPRKPSPSIFRRLALATPPMIVVFAYAVIARRSGLSWPLVAAGCAGALASACVLEWGALALRIRPLPPQRRKSTRPFEDLQVDPSADEHLTSLVYQHLRRRAASAGDSELVELLDDAYAQVLKLRIQPAAAAATAPAASPDEPAAPIALTFAESIDPVAATALDPVLDTSSPAQEAIPESLHDEQPGAAVNQTSAADAADEVPPRRELPARTAGIRGSQLGQNGHAGRSALSEVTETATVAPPSPTPTSEERTPALSRLEGEAGCIVVTLRGTALQSASLSDERVQTIGKGQRCDIRLTSGDPSDLDGVGDEHARLTVRPGRVLFHHVAEGCVSLINGSPSVWATLEEGDEIRVGVFVCTYREAPISL